LSAIVGRLGGNGPIGVAGKLPVEFAEIRLEVLVDIDRPQAGTDPGQHLLGRFRNSFIHIAEGVELHPGVRHIDVAPVDMKEARFVITVHQQSYFPAAGQCDGVDHGTGGIQFGPDHCFPVEIGKFPAGPDLHGGIIAEIVDQRSADIGQSGAGILLLIIRKHRSAAHKYIALSSLKHQSVGHPVPVDGRIEIGVDVAVIIIHIGYVSRSRGGIGPVFHRLGQGQSMRTRVGTVSSGAWAAAIPGIAAVPLRQDQGIHRAEGGKKV